LHNTKNHTFTQYLDFEIRILKIYMADLLKNIYNDSFFTIFCNALESVVEEFNKNNFISKVKTTAWEDYELKQRMAHLAQATDSILPADFEQKTEVIFKLIQSLRQLNVRDQNLEYIFLADIITLSGLNDFDTSIKAMEYVTQFTSFEFAGRPFFIKYPEQMYEQVLNWTTHENHTVRRFSSEGCRPRLPWGMRLKSLVNDPKPIIPILEKLKNDDSEYVRKSVANNLNDISKDHPQLVIALIREWKDQSKNTDWILKHGARTLLKQGHPEVLKLFGTPQDVPCTIQGFKLNTTNFLLGEQMEFQFLLKNNALVASFFRFEYAVYFVKSNGSLSKKIFKISEKLLVQNEEILFRKSHKFIDLTTRKHYSGQHKIAIVVNGLERDSKDFFLEV